MQPETQVKIWSTYQARISARFGEKVNAAAVAKVVEEEFGPKFQRAGGKIVFGDNDKKLHSDV